MLVSTKMFEPCLGLLRVEWFFHILQPILIETVDEGSIKMAYQSQVVKIEEHVHWEMRLKRIKLKIEMESGSFCVFTVSYIQKAI